MDLPPAVMSALRVESIDEAGYGIGFLQNDKRPVRVWGATFGDLLQVEIVHRSPHRLVARIVEVVEAGDRRGETCPHRPDCGGCPQFEARPDRLHDWRLERMRSYLPWLPLRRGQAMGLTPWRERSKWSVERLNGAIVFTVPRPRSREGLASPQCPIVPARSRERLKLLAEQLTAPAFDAVRGLVLTEGIEVEGMAPFGIGLVAQGPMPETRHQVGRPGDSVAWLKAHGSATQFFAGNALPYSGPSCVALDAGSLVVPTPPLAFAQAHPAGRIQMVEQLLAWCGPSQPGRAVDLGSGCGIFARALAAQGWSVDAVEPSPQVTDAWQVSPKSIRFLPVGAEEFAWPDVPNLAVIDPPRAGLNPAWSEPMLAAKPEQIVAIHCGRAAAVRDLTLLRDRGYKPRDAVLLDLFPGSPHGELMSLWEAP